MKRERRGKERGEESKIRDDGGGRKEGEGKRKDFFLKSEVVE